MHPHCRKSKIKRVLYPGIFLVVVLLLGFSKPSQAQTDCGGEACPICGDGIVCTDPALCEPLEQCDDGGLCTGDNQTVCMSDADCATATGTCTPRDGDGCSSTCQIVPIEPGCGNNVLDDGEDCDLVNGVEEGCEEGRSCNAECVCEDVCMMCPRCGDGNPDPDEDCDDGNTVNTDSCKNDCSFNFCSDGILCLDPSTCNPVEECDDGDFDNHDICTNECQFNECGDNLILTGRELCDDGNRINGDGCSDDCLTCPNIECGDGIPEALEECDDGNDNDDDACHNDCTDNICGDGPPAGPNEECDDGNTQAGDGCSSTCMIEEPEEPVCGNGIKEDGEQCDNGAQNANNAACKENCTNNLCGDGFQGPSEECDDGNTIDDDGCSITCVKECGNNELDDGEEECDVVDGNVETDGTCEADKCNTNLCICAICGNGEVGPGETCDDGNTIPGDGCDENCLEEADDCPTNGVTDCDPSHKTLVCHIPPGNPDNAHTICIDLHAVAAHVSNHGDTGVGVGCEDECPGGGIAAGTVAGTTDAGGCSLVRR